MTNFIADNTGVPNGKSDFNTHPEVPTTQKVLSPEWNGVMQDLLDVQGWLRGAPWYGLSPQGSDPAPAGVAHYIYLGTDGQLHMPGGLGLGHAQRFEYTITGAETGFGTNTITIPLPATRPSTSYMARASGAGLSSLVATIDVPQSGLTTTTINVVTSSPLSSGDKLFIEAIDLV